jgi:copper transport protein
VKRVVVLFALVALVAPGAAAAHATFVRSEPENGAVVARAPSVVRVTFDDSIRLATGNEAVANESRGDVLRGRPRIEGHDLVLGLRRDLADGDYSVRWSIVSQDGHREQGVLAFAVGAGRTSPQSVLGASTPLAWNNVVLRTLYLLGILVGAGAALFAAVVPGAVRARLGRPLSHVLFFAMLATFLGGSGILHDAASGTRFGLVLKIAVTLALAGGAAAALAPTYPRLLAGAGACAVLLLAAPTLAGHALDRTQPRLLSVPVDLAHSASAALWFGGLVALVFALPRSGVLDADRDAVVRRFSTVAFASVALLALTGLGRALTEVGGISEVWTTSYGRALLVKTAIFVPLLALGWLNRARLLGAFARLRRSALLETGLLVAVVAVVGVLTELQPGDEAAAQPTAPLAAAQRAALPPADAVVDARGVGTLAVAIARKPGVAFVTVIGQDGTGADGRDVRIDGNRGEACGSGCYRAAAGAGPVAVTIDGRRTTFDIPARAPDATKRLAALSRTVRRARTIVFEETLASSPTVRGTSRFRLVAPDRLAYTTSDGQSAIVIGERRWDRERPGGPFVESAQTRLDVTAPYWAKVTNVHAVAPGVVTFVDPRVPAWFRIDLRGTHPRRVRMTAAGHFMVDRYIGFDVPVTVSPPPSR